MREEARGERAERAEGRESRERCCEHSFAPAGAGSRETEVRSMRSRCSLGCGTGWLSSSAMDAVVACTVAASAGGGRGFCGGAMHAKRFS
jgi:hypothetical protein